MGHKASTAATGGLRFVPLVPQVHHLVSKVGLVSLLQPHDMMRQSLREVGTSGESGSGYFNAMSTT